MDARGGGYGMDAELANKAAGKYDKGMEVRAQKWIEEVTQIQFNSTPFGDMLKDGVVLCKLINTIKPGTISAASSSSMPFKQMENVSTFLKGCRALGVGAHDCFETVDLFEQKDLGVVIQCIFALGGAVQKTCPGFKGPHFGKAGVGMAQGMAAMKVAGSSTAAPVMKQASAQSNYVRDVGTSAQSSYGDGQKDIDVKGRGAGYGMDAALAAKAAAKYDKGAEGQCIQWIEGVTGCQFKSEPFGDMLKDGTLLCQLINTIRAGTVRKINKMRMPFMQMENISNFLQGCRALGVSDHDCFETVDLYEQKDLGVVVNCIIALGRAVQRTCPEFTGPKLGAKESTANKREFTEAQLRAGQGMISKVAMGSNETMEKLDVQKTGITFGNDQSGGGDGSTLTQFAVGSKDIMERKDITRTGITFGNDYAGDGDGSVMTKLGNGSKDIMDRKDITRTGITFGNDYGGGGGDGSVMTKLGTGSKDIMDRTETTKGGITFGHDSSK